MYIHLFIPTEKYLAVFWHMLLLWCCCVIIKAISKIFWSSQYYPPPSTISHPHKAFFPPFFSKTLWIVVKYFLRIFGSTRYLKCTISREAYLPLWVLSTRPFKERIWDSPKNENAPHQMLWKGVSKTLYPNPGIRFSLEFQEEVLLDPQWQSALPSVGTAWSCKLDLGFNGKIATCCWMGSTGPMVMVVAKVVHTELFGLPRYKIAADNPNPSQFWIHHKLFLTEPVYFESRKRSYKDEPVSFVALSVWPSETQFIMFL